MEPSTTGVSGKKDVHVLVVDDSALVRQIMHEILSQERGMTVAVAGDPIIAQEKMGRQRPDVIVLDLEMPRMDGLTFLRKIMARDPIPVVICSALTGSGTNAALRALDEGAIEVITKPRVGVKEFLFESAVVLIDAIRGAAQSRLRTKRVAQFVAPKPTNIVPPRRPSLTSFETRWGLIAIGASTGGTDAIRQILTDLPTDAPPVVIVQHMPANFTRAYAEHLDAQCRLEVKEAVDGDEVCAGRALIAPGNRHMLLRHRSRGYAVEVSDGPLIGRHRPSVNVLFASVARTAGANAMGVILTGMGDDGAEGLLEMKRAGASTIAEDEKSCVVFGMPKAAIELGAVDGVLPLPAIVSTLSAMHASGGILPRKYVLE